MNYKLTIILILAVLALLFVFQNVAIVEIQFLFWSTSMPRSLLVVLLLATGVTIGWFLHEFLRHRKSS
jgi:uncharacterized integral membrane protein